MEISIITAFHKGKQYLSDYFDSLCSQSFHDFEVIFVKDDAEDITDVMEHYQSMLNLKVYTLEGDTSVALARNYGLSKASGEFVYFLDADDYLLDHTLARFDHALEEEPQLEVLYGNKLKTWYKRSITLDALRAERMERWKNELTEAEVSFPEDADEATLETLITSIFGDEILARENEEDALLDIAETELSDEDMKKAVWDDSDSEGYDSEEQTSSVVYGDDLPEKEKLRLVRLDRAGGILVSSRRGIKNISALHMLVKRSLLTENHIQFDPEAVYYADLSFVMAVLDKTKECRRVYSSKYYQRKHNDPINLPSIAQQKSETRFDELLTAYEKAAEMLPEKSPLLARLQRKIVNYYCNYFVVQMHRSPQSKWKEERFDQMRAVISRIDHSVLKEFNLHKRRLVKALLKGDSKKAERIATGKLAVKKAWSLLKNPRLLKRAFYTYIYCKQPMMEKTVLFESFFGGFYTDSPKYLFEQLIKAYPGEYTCVWVYKDKKLDIPFPCKQVKRFSLNYFKYLARAKYFVFNGRQPVWFDHREGMVFLETWHGTPLKRLVFDQEEVLSASPTYKQTTYKMTRAWDYLVSPNEFCTHTFRDCFMFDKMMLNTGYPRNDILHSENKEQLAAQIRAKLGIPVDKKTILYAPTWRDDEYYGPGQYKFSLKLDLQMMREQLPSDYVVLLRTHYFIADAIDTTGLEGFVYNVCRYNDIAELYLISDILITDYSSVFFDYAGLKRPMLFYTYDLEKYRDDLRGFYIDMETEVPGPLLLTTEEVIDAIQNIDEVNEKYADCYQKFYQRFCGWEDGHASEKIVNFVFKGKAYDNHEECEK